jgi:hypothetical protein
MTVNFKTPEGLEILHRLVKQSDILVENFVSGKLATMGLGWEDCRKINPRLIYASITGAFFCIQIERTQTRLLGYGQTGPYREAAGYDVIIEGEAGLMHMSVIPFLQPHFIAIDIDMVSLQNRRSRPTALQSRSRRYGYCYRAVRPRSHHGSVIVTPADRQGRLDRL